MAQKLLLHVLITYVIVAVSATGAHKGHFTSCNVKTVYNICFVYWLCGTFKSVCSIYMKILSVHCVKGFIVWMQKEKMNRLVTN